MTIENNQENINSESIVEIIIFPPSTKGPGLYLIEENNNEL
jgi:hypothetical protein